MLALILELYKKRGDGQTNGRLGQEDRSGKLVQGSGSRAIRSLGESSGFRYPWTQRAFDPE